jgi:hypothetical protein
MKSRILKAIVTVCACVVLQGCSFFRGSDAPCPEAPKTSDSSENRKIVDLATKLANLQVDANVKLEFTKVLKDDFQKLSDQNIAYLLFLRELDCLVKRARTKADREFLKPIIAELFHDTRMQWAASKGISGPTDRLTPLEHDMIKSPGSEGSRHSSEILRLLKKHGVK